MSLLGKFLAVLNLGGLCAFFYLAIVDFQVRQAWSYAVFRHDIAIHGLPVDETETDGRSRLIHPNVDAVLAGEVLDTEVFVKEAVDEILGGNVPLAKLEPVVERVLGKVAQFRAQNKREPLVEDYLKLLETETKNDRPSKEELKKKDVNEILKRNLAQVRTQMGVLDQRRDKLIYRINAAKILGSRAEKAVEVLMALGTTMGEREELQKLKDDKSDANVEKLLKLLESRFQSVKELKDLDARKRAVARVLLATTDVLSTDEEKNLRAQVRDDPLSDPAYRRTANALGFQGFVSALERQALELLTLGNQVADARQQERVLFAYQHQSLINQLIEREHALQEQIDLLEVKNAQVKVQKERAEAQQALRTAKLDELEGLRIDTFKGKKDARGQLARDDKGQVVQPGLEQLEEELNRVYRLRKMLRDANQVNQDLEATIRRLETTKGQKGSD